MKVVRLDTKDGQVWGVLSGSKVMTAATLSDVLEQRFDGEISHSSRALVAPCVPDKIVGIAQNYPGVGSSTPAREPLAFLKATSALVGPSDPIALSPHLDRTWGEAELAIVLKSGLTRANVDQATAAILGYAVANDVTGADLTGRDHHLARYKSPDSYCVVGPWIDTEFVPGDQRVAATHNGTLLREGRLCDRYFKDAELLSWISSWMTLSPGDVVLTGAPPRIRERSYLQTGDTFVCEVAGLGVLKNEVVASEID